MGCPKATNPQLSDHKKAAGEPTLSRCFLVPRAEPLTILVSSQISFLDKSPPQPD